MKITTTAQAKTAVSSLRREIKALGKAPAALSHNDCLTLMAKAMGYPSWNAWEASLLGAEPKAEAPKPLRPKYPLVNDGSFDFVEQGEDGQAFFGNFTKLDNLEESMLVTAPVNSVSRTSEGTVGVEYADDNRIAWDSQEARDGADGFSIWSVETPGGDFKEYSEAQLIIVPDDCDDPCADWDLPVRPKLLEVFNEYFQETGVAGAVTALQVCQAEAVIGFSLTEKEQAEFLKQRSM